MPLFDIFSHGVKPWQTLKHLWTHISLLSWQPLRGKNVLSAPQYLMYGDPDGHCFILSQLNTTFHESNNIFISVNKLVSHCLTKMKTSNISVINGHGWHYKVCVISVTYSWISMTLLPRVCDSNMPGASQCFTSVSWEYRKQTVCTAETSSTEVLTQYVWIFHWHVNTGSKFETN